MKKSSVPVEKIIHHVRQARNDGNRIAVAKAYWERILV
jgi:hypothetical protein